MEWLFTCMLTSLTVLVAAQFPPTPEGATVLQSKFHENVTLSFKEVGEAAVGRGIQKIILLITNHTLNSRAFARPH